MKLYRVIKAGADSALKLYDIKKRKSAKKLLTDFPTLFYKSFGKARRALSVDYKAKIAEIRETLKQIRSIKKNDVKVVKIKVADKMKGFETLKEEAAKIKPLPPPKKREKRSKKKGKKGKKRRK